MNPKIGIIGCGWLGLPLAKSLTEGGYQVNGSTTSETKLTVLKHSKITPFLINISSEGIKGNITTCLSGCNSLVINIPPGLRKNPKHNYVQKMSHLLDAIENSSVDNVLFIGSTSVYDNAKSFPLITEDSETSKSETALQLLAVEKMFRDSNSFQTTILRFSGLFGEDRHPARFLSGRTGLKNPDAPVNLIHRDDCISIIGTILHNNIWNTTLNASTAAHPTKESYYTSICNSFKIGLPEFNHETKSIGKIIDSARLKQILNYTFKVTITK